MDHRREEPSGGRGLTRRWVPRTPERVVPATLPLVERVLRARGLDDTTGPAFLDPSLQTMHDPGLLPDIDKAARRILDALTGRERVVIYGDYDVDGVTASAILIHMIRAIDPDADVRAYIPHRIDEGYGINADAIAQLASDGARVILSVDCGITAVEPALVAARLGVDLIITDHHNPPAVLADLPAAYAVVHPRRPDSRYPFGDLCGAGVAYKLAWRLATMHAGGDKASPACRSLLIELLGFAALGTIADIVPLRDENRVITRHGLRQLARPRNEGLHALIHASGLDSDKVDAEAVGFRLAPRLNAVGRLGHAREALELLTEASGERAKELAEMLSSLNEERRRVERSIVDEACRMAEEAGMTGPGVRAIVLAHEGWHPGVVGIVCSRLVEKYGRPTVLMQRDGDMCKGSGRSIEGFNLHGALEHCAAHLDRFGGHDMAAGMACRTDRLDGFTRSFLDYCNGMLTDDDLIPVVRYDTEADIAELGVREAQILEKLAPFGPGNPRVRLLVRGRVCGQPRMLGARGDHLAFQLGSTSGSAARIVAWGWGDKAVYIRPGEMIEAIVEPKLSTWNGSTRVEPVLADLRVLGETGMSVGQRYSVGADA